MAAIKYLGGAMDHKVTPQVLKMGDNGKAVKRKVIVPAKTELFERQEYDLWGLKCPKGVEVEVPAKLVAQGILKKAKALKCFEIYEHAIKLEEQDEPSAEVADAPKRRGRKPKAEAAEAQAD